jgi:hypothetical protein
MVPDEQVGCEGLTRVSQTNWVMIPMFCVPYTVSMEREGRLLRLTWADPWG